MKKTLLKTFLLTIALGIISTLFVYLLTRPALWSFFDLTNTSSIGETLGGITAPILGIVSVIFLYLTLNKQIDSSNNQKLKNESDIIFMLFNQLENEYNQIYLYETSKGERKRKTGFEALTDFAKSWNNFYSGDQKFSRYYMADNIMLTVKSFKLIEKYISLSSIQGEMKNLFNEKLKAFFICKLEDPLLKLTETFDRVDSLKDHYTEEISEFYILMKTKIQ